MSQNREIPLFDRANTVLAVVNWFEKRNECRVPVVLFKHPLFLPENPLGPIFGYAEKTGIAVSLTSILDVFCSNRAEVPKVTMDKLCDMALIHTTLEELYHIWQFQNYPAEVMTSGSLHASTRDGYLEDPIEVEAKSFAYSKTEEILREMYPNDDETFEFFRDNLTRMRKAESGMFQ